MIHIVTVKVNSFLNLHRSQEEESLRAAIALSKQETLQEGDEGETSEEPPTTNGEPNLLLDFSSTGESAIYM